jgi:hypothetical protein
VKPEVIGNATLYLGDCVFPHEAATPPEQIGLIA